MLPTTLWPYIIGGVASFIILQGYRMASENMEQPPRFAVWTGAVILGICMWYGLVMLIKSFL